ncbi:6-phosphogluconate phosphatase, partial [Enterobacter cloacae]
NKPIDLPRVTAFTDLAQLPEWWKARGWNIPR